LNKWRNLLGKIEFHFFLAIITVLAFCWPFFTTPNLSNNIFVFYFFFASWLTVIVIHFLMDRFSFDENDRTDEEKK